VYIQNGFFFVFTAHAFILRSVLSFLSSSIIPALIICVPSECTRRHTYLIYVVEKWKVECPIAVSAIELSARNGADSLLGKFPYLGNRHVAEKGKERRGNRLILPRRTKRRFNCSSFEKVISLELANLIYDVSPETSWKCSLIGIESDDTFCCYLNSCRGDACIPNLDIKF